MKTINFHYSKYLISYGCTLEALYAEICDVPADVILLIFKFQLNLILMNLQAYYDHMTMNYFRVRTNSTERNKSDIFQNKN